MHPSHLPDPDATITLAEVTKRFGARVALDGVSLSVPRGQVLGLLGPNGAGKTTIIDLAAGLSRPSAGEVLLNGAVLPFPFPPSARRRIGLVPQHTALYDELSVAANLRFAADLFAVASPKRRVAEVLDLMGLGDRAGDRVSTLSGGMQRRLAFGRALVHDPDVLILDEPTLGVDIENRHAIWAHVRRLRRDGKTVLLSTNYLDEAEALCDRVVALRAGRQIAAGPTAELLRVAGRRVEVDCAEDAVPAVRRSLDALGTGARLEVHDGGMTVHLPTDAPVDAVAAAALCADGVLNVRVRAPDMVEVLEALSAGSHG